MDVAYVFIKISSANWRPGRRILNTLDGTVHFYQLHLKPQKMLAKYTVWLFGQSVLQEGTFLRRDFFQLFYNSWKFILKFEFTKTFHFHIVLIFPTFPTFVTIAWTKNKCVVSHSYSLWLQCVLRHSEKQLACNLKNQHRVEGAARWPWNIWAGNSY